MHTRVVTLVVMFMSGVCVARAQQGTIRGRLKERDQPLEYANVVVTSLLDSTTVLAFGTSDTSGNFLLQELPMGQLLLRIQRIGYNTVYRQVTLSSALWQVDLGVVQITPDKEMLQNVTVTARKKMIQKTPQGFIIKADDNLTQAAGTVTDLLASTPTVLVDAEGAISVRGKAPTILINGRNSALGASSLERLPASSIDRIEIINNPGARYDADGEGGIINIVLKKSLGKGTNGSVLLGAGAGAKGRYNSSFQINQENNGVNLGLSYDNRFAGRVRKAVGERVNFNSFDNYLLQQTRNDHRDETTHNFRLNTQFPLGKKNEFGLEAIYSYNHELNVEALTNTLSNQNAIFTSKNERTSHELQNEQIFGFALNYSRKFAQKGKQLTAELTSDIGNEKQNTNITTLSLNESSKPVGDPFLQRTRNYEKPIVGNARVDYAIPISATAMLEAGYKGIFRWQTADFETAKYVNDDYVVDSLTSNLFTFSEQVHAGYLQYSNSIGEGGRPKWKYDAGVRTELVNNQGQNAKGKNGFTNDYVKFFPTANLVYYTNRQSFWKLTYNKRINRPGLGALNPFIDITDSLNQHGGNPKLKPEIINAVEAGYNKDFNRTSVSAVVFYRNGSNTILPFTQLDTNGIALTTPQNFGRSVTYGLEVVFSVQTRKIWNASGSLSMYQQNIDGTKGTVDISNSALTWYAKIINNFEFWKGGKIQVAGRYQAPTATPQGTRIAVYNVDFGYQQKIMKGKGRIGLAVPDIFDIQQSGIKFQQPDFTYQRTFKIDTRAVLLTFAYTFGTAFKEKLMENHFNND